MAVMTITNLVALVDLNRLGQSAPTMYGHDVEDLAAGRVDRLTIGYFPKASEALNAFIGFFDAEFRLFDFYLGMYDAYRELKTGGWLGEKYDVDALVASCRAELDARGGKAIEIVPAREGEELEI